MGKIISICVEKGGVGKTTAATNLAVMLNRAGRDVVLVDADPQFTLKGWLNDRVNNGVEPHITLFERTGNILNDLVSMAGRCDYLIVDTGGRDSQEMRQALAAVTRVPGSFVLTPMLSGTFDLKTVGPLVTLLYQVESMTGVLPPCLTFINRASSHHMNREAEEAKAAMKEVPALHVLESVIRERTAQRRDAPRLGMSCVELPRELHDASLTAQWESLFDEIFRTGLLGSGGVPVGFED